MKIKFFLSYPWWSDDLQEYLYKFEKVQNSVMHDPGSMLSVENVQELCEDDRCDVIITRARNELEYEFDG